MNSNPTIDSHVHVWSSRVAQYPLAIGYSVMQMSPSSFTPEDFWTAARPLGVERAVLIQMDFYGYDNSYLLDALRRYPQAFAGVAQVNENGPDPAGEMSRLKAFGIRGLRLLPPRRGDPNWFDSQAMRAMWRRGADECMAICPLIEAVNLPALVRMCQLFPATPVVIDHAANIGGDGRFCEADMKKLSKLSRFMNVYVKLSAFYYLGRKHPPYDDVVPLIRRLIESFGPQRLMWGSDSPFQLEPPNSYEASFKLIHDRLDFVSADDKDWLLHRTAARVFFS